MSISIKIIKKILFTVSFMFTTFFTLTSYGQTFQSDIANLGKQNTDWNVLNTPNLLKKTSLKVSDLTPAQLSDATIPNSIEINEINKSIQQRDRTATAYAQITRKYIKPPEAAEAMVKNIKDFLTSMNTASIKLRDGKINFGQYNQEKQKLFAQVNANENTIVQKFDLKSQLSGGQAPQQTPQASNTSVPRSSNSPADQSQNTELANRLAKCAGSYKFAAIVAGPNDPNSATLTGTSNISMNVANILTKTSPAQLKQIRDNEVAILTSEFEKVANTNDKQRILAWGNSIGARNNACTAFITPLASKIQQDINNSK